MEVHFECDVSKRRLMKSNDLISQKLFKKISKIHEYLQSEKTKGIPREISEEKFLILFEKNLVILIPKSPTKTMKFFLEFLKFKIKISDEISLKRGKLVSTDVEGWTAPKKLKISSSNDKRWTTLEHNGVYLADEYVPHSKRILFKDSPRKITPCPRDEELLMYYATRLHQDTSNPDVTQYTSDEGFHKKYISDLKKYISDKELYTRLRALDIREFNKVFKHYLEHITLAKSLITPEFKALVKIENLKIKRKYENVLIDDRKEKLASFRVEPPGLFLGRGKNPLAGSIKPRIMSSDVTLNLSESSRVPKPNDGGEWGNIIHDHSVTWIATWTDVVTGKNKYVFLSQTSQLRGENDMLKYEKARTLTKTISKIQKAYTKDISSRVSKISQLGIVVYLIDNFAFRVGNEKNSDEADTVGVTTLKISNISLGKSPSVTFDFLGKDSIRFHQTLDVDEGVYQKLEKRLEQASSSDEELFNEITSKDVNEYLKIFSSFLTAKVFRTFRASTTYATYISQNVKKRMTSTELITVEKDANRQVAVLCNHQRKVSAKSKESISAKRQRLSEIKKEYKTSEGKKKESLRKRYDALRLATSEQTKNLDVACTTSKLNYIDPRITVGYAKSHNLEIGKLLTSAHLKKFTWALDSTDEDWDYFTSKLLL